MSNVTCYVTGANGYVGDALCTSLKAAGHKVIRLVREPKAYGYGEALPFKLGDPLPRIEDGANACIIHCAYDFSAVTRDDVFQQNVEGTRRIIDGAREQSVSRFVFISSISAYENCKSLYGQAKLSIEEEVRKIGGVIIRPGLVYGDTPGGMVASLNAVAAKAPVIPVVGASQQLYLCHQDDLSEIVCRAVAGKVQTGGRPITAAYPQPVPFGNILRTLAKKQGREPVLVPIPWQLVWCPLKLSEKIGLRIGFRSDSLTSLLHPNPAPDFTTLEMQGVAFRPFR